MWEEKKTKCLDKKSEWIPPLPTVDWWTNNISRAIIGRVRGVDIWRCAYDQFFIPINVCLHCFLSKLKYLCIFRMQSLVCDWFGHYIGHGAIGASNQSVKLDLAFSIGFILYFLIYEKRFWSFAHLCLFSLHKVHFSLPQIKAGEHARIVLTPHFLRILSILCDVFRDLGVSALCIEKMWRMHATN